MIHGLVNVVDKFLVGHRTLRETESWLASRIRLIHQSGDQRAIELANQLEADLIDLGEGLLDEATIRERWEGYLRQAGTLVLTTAKAAVETVTSTDSITLRSSYAAPEGDVTLWLTHRFAA